MVSIFWKLVWGLITWWIVLALWTLSKNIFPPAQLTYLSECSNNWRNSCCLVPKQTIRVPMLFLDYHHISVSSEGGLRAICLEPTTGIWLNKLWFDWTTVSFNEFCNPLHSWNKQKIAKIKDSVLHQRDYKYQTGISK